MSKSKDNKDIDVENVYKGMSLHEHILSAPDTYIGTTSVDDVRMFIYDEETNKIVDDVIGYIAGFFKIFDEILVNARDHTVRDKTCKNIKINIDKKSGKISVWNDGHGIPVCMHKQYDMYVPQMIFGNLLTSQNYGKKGKTVGGKNGYGAKLSNIYSREFEIHTVGVDKITEIDGKIVPDEKAKKVEYKQLFKNNMYDIQEPEINKKISQSTKTFTKITYLPDYERFGMSGLTNDMYCLLIKRCYDIAACTSKTINIYINDEEIKCRDFKDYIKLYYSDEQKPKITYENVNSRWEVGVGFNKNVGDRYISFVNGISTFQGGTHVAHVVTNIVAKVTAHIKKKKEHKDLKIAPTTIKQYLTFFINCIVEDPGFNSQTKEYMNSKIADWCNCGNNCKDVKCDISDDFIEKLCANGLMKEVVEMSQFKEQRDLVKTDGKKVGNLRNVEKLIDAEWAGKKNSHKTALFLTEGDSAKAFVVAGISVIGNERYGVFPLRGKLLNVRNASAQQIQKNSEFANIKQILGLKQGVKYRDTSKLRYGSVIILTDQDPDGSHIKGLVINMFEFFWPELLQIEGFIKAYNTPIVKTWKKTDKKREKEKMFYSVSEYESWRDKCDDISKWETKYYKGLGTSSSKEANESFQNFEDNIVNFYWEEHQNDDTKSTDSKKKKKVTKKIVKNDEDDNIDKEIENIDDDKTDEKIDINTDNDSNDYSYTKSKSHGAITKAFDESKVEMRKEWLRNFKRENTLEYKPRMNISFSEFIDKDLINFSNMDNDRSIPSMVDGFKPSQRMIMYCCFKRGRKSKEVKVAQLSGYVSEHTDYHHGEASLQGAIIGLAQNYPGSNNINLLKPNGNFGHRRQGGKDHASPRYIFTEVDPVTNYIFREEDDEILNYKYVDGMKVEPDYYAPIIPMILVNGAQGIGTGFSTTIPPYNPKDIVSNLKRLLKNKQMKEMTPWFNGFKGSIEPANKPNQYIIKGKYSINDSIVHIEDIPIVNGWIEPYEKELDMRVSVSKDDGLKIEDIKKKISNEFIDMKVIFKGNELQKMYKNGSLEKFLMMTQNMSIKNIHLFDSNGKLTKYDSVNDIIQEFFEFRLEVYGKRREYYLKKLNNDLDISKFKVKFIEEYLEGTLLIAKKKISEVIQQLENKKYPKLAHDYRVKDDSKSYRYLTDMSIMSMTQDKINELKENMKECQDIYDKYFNTTVHELWMKELDEFMNAYDKWLDEWADKIENADKEKEPKKSKKIIKK